MTVFSTVGIILDPSEVADDRTELNINTGAIRIASAGPDWGDAAIAAAIADRKFGSVPVGYRIPNRFITIPLIVRAVTGTTFNEAQTKLQQKVARFQDEGGWLKRTSSDGTTKLYADVVDATLTFPDPRFQDVEGGVVLTLECLPDFYGDEVGGSSLNAGLLALDPIALFAPDPDTGTVIDRTGNYTATLTNGATVTSDELVDGEPGAISLDGTNDYVATTATTRRNLVTNPSFETGTTGWTLGGASWASSSFTRTAGSYTGSAGSYYARIQGVKDATTTQRTLFISSQSAVTAGTTYTFSVYFNVIDAATAFNLQIDWYNGGAYLSSSATTPGAITGTQRLSLTTTAPATATMATIYPQAVSNVSGDTVDFYVDAILFEAASSAGPYFDGSGHVNASGTWVPATDTFRTDLGDTAWTGTAHDSTSTRAGRTNLCTNPRAAVDTAGWTNSGGASLTRNASPASGLPTGITESFNFVGNSDLDNAQDSVAVTSGTTYTFTALIRVNSLSATSVILRWCNAAGTTKASATGITVTGQWVRVSVSVTADATETWTTRILQSGAGAADVDFTTVLTEASSSVNSYFDGSGSVEHQGLTGWLGLEHASASDKGIFANGTTRTFVAAVNRDTLTTDQMVIGGAEGSPGVGAYIHSSDVPAFTANNGSIFNVASGGALIAGQAALVAWEFDEPGNLLSFKKDGAAINNSANSDQFGAGKTLQIGAYGSTTNFDGLIGPVAIFDRALTAEEHRVLGGYALAEWVSSSDNDAVTLVENDIPGDYPARSTYTFTDTGSQNRQAVVIASQSRTYDSASTADLVYEAEALTPLGTAAVGTVTGAHGGASNNAVVESSVWSSETPILSTEIDGTGHMTHWGDYRVFARVRAPDTDVFVRFDYSAGDASKLTQGPVVEVSASSAFYIIDLGEIRIPKVPVGAQQWEGRVIAYNEEGSSAGADFAVDKLYFAPTESLSIIRPRVSLITPPAVGTGYGGFDSFQQAAGALTGESASIGGTWAGAGDADDFTNDGTNKVTRTATSDASGDASDGRVMSLGSSTYTNVAATLSTQHTGGGAYAVLVLRYTDINNFAAVLYYPLLGTIGVQTIVGGTKTDLTSAVVPVFSDAYSAVTAYVDASGYLTVWTGPNYAGGQFVTTVYSSALATGGTLASGKVGFGDQNPSATASTRSYSYFAAWVPDVDAACLSGKSLSARYDGAWRETSDSGIYAPAHVEGSYPRAPASGLEARTCRTLVLPSAGDLGTLPDVDPVGFSVQSHHAPAVLFVTEQ